MVTKVTGDTWTCKENGKKTKKPQTNIKLTYKINNKKWNG